MYDSKEIQDMLSPSSLDEGWIDRKVLNDPRIHALELERIFARCWLFLGHESQLPNAGSFITTWMGTDNVLVVRRRDSSIGAYINSCPHRGNRVVTAGIGKANAFTCNYHCWSFDLSGKLIAVHEEEAFKRDPGYDRSQLGLPPVRVATYKGLIFGTFDAQAPTLEEYLGPFAYLMDVVLDNDPGGTEFIPGSGAYTVECNYKDGALNFAGDALHLAPTHASASRVMIGRDIPPLGGEDAVSYQVNFNGHCWEFNLDKRGNAATLGSQLVMDYLRELEPQFVERLGPIRARMVASTGSVNLWPNFSFAPGLNTFRVWEPKGPDRTVLRHWVLVNRDAPAEVKEEWRKGVMKTFSAAGAFEAVGDVQSWRGVTASHRGTVTRRHPLYARLGEDTRLENSDLGFPEELNVYRGQVSDANTRHYLRTWYKWMSA
ncbi:aromatic ring-hydroxylating oxygenase subunit alpha [Streptomyces rhizosphaericus]|uniref:aromatic ring-hydroxylating oxygenase subunit alpha n=1 Tax=Streptomyces rhizosphaericus TaxID=114699 RepID=UPI000A37EC66|nr:Rieske 2Fe-2S domain-containing protein [Streptomyces rhizosphaericus]